MFLSMAPVVGGEGERDYGESTDGNHVLQP